MSEPSIIENDFLTQLNAIIERNLADEKFGVSELADEMSMSRSNLLRKVKKETKLSVSQLISQVRLKRAMELLRKSSLNVSEVSHQVGFNSTSYFIKCFREYYGYPPGEVGKRDETEIPVPPSSSKRKVFIGIAAAIVILAIAVASLFYGRTLSNQSSIEKSIAVLPFKNDSNDSSNVYLINGLMESTLNNLQKIKNLKVISRTSTESYRNTSQTIPEMAKVLDVNYFVEGSGQKIGDQILLNIQLIEGNTDKHLWAKQYRRETKDIFALQQEIAKNIAEEIQVILTPEEKNKIEKIPTDNLEAYDSYLKGRNAFHRAGRADLEEALIHFNKATSLDPEFGLAYAEIAMVYYYLDVFQAERKYSAELNNNADKALLYEPKAGASLVAKALSYSYKKDYKTAVTYLEKALEYNPTDGLVINFLSDFYNIQVPNTEKYLEYSLMGVRLNSSPADSLSTSFKYLHLSNALVQAGFLDDAYVFAKKSYDYNPKNPFAGYLKIFIMFAKDRDAEKAKNLLVAEMQKGAFMFYIGHEVGKLCYLQGDYEEAYIHYKKFVDTRAAMKLELLENENLTISMVYEHEGKKQEAEELMKDFLAFVEKEQSIYKSVHLSMYNFHIGDNKKGLEYLKQFSKEDNFQYWILLLPSDPIVNNVKDLPEFKKIMSDIESKFWSNHERMKQRLEEKGLISL